MKKPKNNMRTYIRGNISRKLQEKVDAHMDFLGFDFIGMSGEYGYESDYCWHPITACRDVLGPSNQLPMHSHTFMEIFRYTSESRVEYLIGTHRYIVQKGDIICVPPGTFHQVLHYEPEDIPCARDLIAISPSFLEFISWSNQPDQYFLLRALDDKMDYLGFLCETCVQENQIQGPRWRDMMAGCIQILLAQIVRNSDRAIQAEDAGLFEKILAYIDNNLNQKITLGEASKHFFISERSISREFQKHLGISFYHYVTQRRMLMAQNLIYQDIPLEEICQRVGYGDYPTFYRAFKKEYGISPRQMKTGGQQ